MLIIFLKILHKSREKSRRSVLWICWSLQLWEWGLFFCFHRHFRVGAHFLLMTLWVLFSMIYPTFSVSTFQEGNFYEPCWWSRSMLVHICCSVLRGSPRQDREKGTCSKCNGIFKPCAKYLLLKSNQKQEHIQQIWVFVDHHIHPVQF